jgi:hypothetical protein
MNNMGQNMTRPITNHKHLIIGTNTPIMIPKIHPEFQEKSYGGLCQENPEIHPLEILLICPNSGLLGPLYHGA